MIFSETIAIPDSVFRLSVSPLSFQRNPLIFSRLFYPRHLFFFFDQLHKSLLALFDIRRREKEELLIRLFTLDFSKQMEGKKEERKNKNIPLNKYMLPFDPYVLIPSRKTFTPTFPPENHLLTLGRGCQGKGGRWQWGEGLER